MKKEVGVVGLGKMGSNLSWRLMKKDWKVVGYNRSPEDTRVLEKEGLIGAYSLSDLVQKLEKPRVIITILTAGRPTDQVLDSLLKLVDKEDVIVEFSNSYYLDTQRRAKKVEKKGVAFIDVGISGGPGGALNGACLMVGGNIKTFEYIKPLLVDEARPGAIAHFEGYGAGHFVKMVHNGIEYGMMQSIAEGFSLLKNGPYELDLNNVAEIYQNGSVVESRLVGWLKDAFKKYGTGLEKLSGAVGFTGEGEWTAKTARKLGIPAKAIEYSVKFRIQSQESPSFAGKVLTAMRNQFGGHSIERGKMT